MPLAWRGTVAPGRAPARVRQAAVPVASVVGMSAPPDTEAREIERLRARVAELERELGEQAARANAAIAAAQERAYWLDRWHVDLNALMATRWGKYARALLRAIRTPIRAARVAKRRLLQ